jgi:hypothetical protein
MDYTRILFCETRSLLPYSCLLPFSTRRCRRLDERRRDTKRRQTNINVAACICIASDFHQREVTTSIGISNAFLINFFVFITSSSLSHCLSANACVLCDGLHKVEWLLVFSCVDGLQIFICSRVWIVLICYLNTCLC